MSIPAELACLLVIQLAAKARSRWQKHADLQCIVEAAIAQSLADLACALGEPIDLDGDEKYFGAFVYVQPGMTPEQAARKVFNLLRNVITLHMHAGEALDEYAEATQAHIDLLTKKS